MRRRTFLGNKYKISGGNIPASQAKACDICLYEKGTDSLVIIPYSLFNVKTYPSHSYSLVGVVVIPGSHNVYGDGSCAVMSLKEMNYNTPDTGSTSYELIAFGQHSTIISSLTNYNKVCHIGSSTDGISKKVQGIKESGYLPSDTFELLQNPYDTDTYYGYNGSIGYYIPSPYNEDDTRNPAYYQTASPSSTANCLSDFDGKGNTEKLINLATAQSDWKTASTITNNGGIGYSPAACCCWRYHTEGTKQGDWYLPACGELGYIMINITNINQPIYRFDSSYGLDKGINLNYNKTYMSSTEFDDYYFRDVYTKNGYVSMTNKLYGCNVRAFLRVK